MPCLGGSLEAGAHSRGGGRAAAAAADGAAAARPRAGAEPPARGTLARTPPAHTTTSTHGHSTQLRSRYTGYLFHKSGRFTYKVYSDITIR